MVLVLFWVVLWVITVVLLLGPPSSFSALWHIASDDFNGPNPENPVWAAWQAEGHSESKGMSSAFRGKLFLLSLGDMAAMAVWDLVVVQGPVKRWVKKAFPSVRPVFDL